MPQQIVSTGLKVSQSAIQTLPQTATGTIFTVTGAVWVQAIFGVVTTAVQAQATTFKFSSKVGALASVDMNIAAGSDLTGATVGTVFMPVTTFGTALTIVAAGVVIGVPITAPPMAWIISGSGIITGTTVASSTGAAQYSCLWAPMSPGATVV